MVKNKASHVKKNKSANIQTNPREKQGFFKRFAMVFESLFIVIITIGSPSVNAFCRCN